MPKIVFFGTPDYVLPVLKSLYKAHEVVAIVTQKPKPVGRKQFIAYSPVDTFAHKHKIPVFYKSIDLLKENIKADVGVLESYGEILPGEVLRFFPHGILNIHPSLLPHWRGASPVQATIISGEAETGATTIVLDEKIDHGPIVSRFKEAVLPTDTTGTLRTRLFERAADVLIELLPAYVNGKITPRLQEESLATFTTRIKKEDGFIPPEHFATTLQGLPFKGTPAMSGRWKIPFIKNCSLVPSVNSLDSFIRAMDPWPGAWTHVQLPAIGSQQSVKRLKILKAHVEGLMHSAYPLVPDLVQLEGKKEVSWEEFKQGYPNFKFVL